MQPWSSSVFGIGDGDSFSTQSTARSYPEVAGQGGNNNLEQNMFSAQSGIFQSISCDLASLRSPSGIDCPSWWSTSDPQPSLLGQAVFSSEWGYGETSTVMPIVPMANPDSPVVTSPANGSQTVSHDPPQITVMDPAGVPFPVLRRYLNPKQYNAIMRRRKHRSKLGARSKSTESKKSYLHESRHLHALKRPRGAGGRFLRTPKLQEPQPSSSSTDAQVVGSGPPPFNGNASDDQGHHQENYMEGAFTPCCSCVTNGSNSGGLLPPPEFMFSSSYPAPPRIVRSFEAGNIKWV